MISLKNKRFSQKIEALPHLFFEELNRQNDNLLLWVPLALGLGIGAYFSLPYEPQDFSYAVLIPVFALLYYAGRYRYPSSWAGAYGFIFFVAVFMAVGFSIAQWNTQRLYSPVLEKETKTISLQGKIIDIDRQEKGIRFVLSDVFFETETKTQMPHKVRVMVRNLSVMPQVGDKIEVLARLSPPSAPVLPNGFDFQRFSYFQQIGAVGFALSPVRIVEPRTDKPFFEDMRQKIIESINARIKDKSVASVTATFMTGEKGAIPEETLEVIRQSGLAHLLAISGLHVGFVAGIVFFFLRAVLALSPHLALHYPIKQFSAFFALIAAVLFMLIVGASVPTQRAVIMSGLVLFAVMINRTAISLRLVAIAATLILLYEPHQLMSVSFQLSFAAVVGLVAFYEAIRPYYYKLNGQSWYRKVLFYLLGTMLTSLIAGFATAPFVLYHFNEFAVYGILGNMLALPIMGFIVMPLVLVAYPAFLLGFEGLIYPLLGYFISLILQIAEFVASIKGAVVMMPMWPLESLVLFTLSALFLILWKGFFLRTFAVIGIVLALVFSFSTKLPDVLMSPDLNLIAVKDTQGNYIFSQGRSDRFIRTNWMQANAQKEALYWPKERGQTKDKSLICDEDACLYQSKGKTISFIRHKRVIQKECAKNDLVVFKGYLSFDMKCPEQKTVQYKKTKGSGVSYMYLEEGKKLTLQNTKTSRGERPWVR